MSEPTNSVAVVKTEEAGALLPPAVILAHHCVFVRDSDTQSQLFKLGFGASRSQDDSKRKAPKAEEGEDASASKPCVTALLLLDEEALYLTMHGQIAVYQNSSPSSAASTSCDSMDISDVTPTVVSTDDLYTIFFNKSPNFPLKYKVYEYFRDKGCCVHTAVNYGLDFAIYQTIPSLCHSALSVLVIDGVRHGEAEESLRWTHMSAMTRVMGDVSKLLLLCHVIPISEELFDNSHPLFNDCESEETIRHNLDLNQLSCLDSLTVKPVTAVVRRHIADNSDHYVTVQSMQQSFAKNLKASGSSKNRGGKPKKNGEGGSAPTKKRKRKGDSASGQDVEKEVKVSRHAKHWKSLYIATEHPGGGSSSSSSSSSSASSSSASSSSSSSVAGDNNNNREEGSENEGGLFGWLGALFSGSEY